MPGPINNICSCHTTTCRILAKWVRLAHFLFCTVIPGATASFITAVAEYRDSTTRKCNRKPCEYPWRITENGNLNSWNACWQLFIPPLWKGQGRASVI